MCNNLCSDYFQQPKFDLFWKNDVAVNLKAENIGTTTGSSMLLFLKWHLYEYCVICGRLVLCRQMLTRTVSGHRDSYLLYVVS